jgi:HAD superfamily hydrolase (TIGR01509 family)
VLKACAFDLGNTLIDDTKLLRETTTAMGKWLRHKGLIESSATFLETYLQVNRRSNLPFISHTFGEELFFAQAFHELGISAVDPGEGLAAYRRLLMRRMRIARGVRSGLELLHSRSLLTALITNESTARTDAFLGKTRLRECFDLVVVSQDVGHEKPQPEIFRLASERLGVCSTEMAMFGDNPIADGGCKQLGMWFVLVTRFKKPDWGWEQGTSIDPDFVIDAVEPKSLLRFLDFVDSG